MIVDLHIHTKHHSPCSQIDPREMLAEAKRVGLEGICLTEHHVLWDPVEIEELAGGSGVKIFTGTEITTDQGDILVLAYPIPVPGVIPIAELRQEVSARGGFMIAAHPLRGFRAVSLGQINMTADHAARRKVFQYVDAVEVKNGRLSDGENAMACQVAQYRGLPGIAGSDAHRIDEIGKWVTIFERTITNEKELIGELRAGRFTIGTVR